MTPADLAALHALCFTTPRPWSEAEFSGFLSSPFVFLLTDHGGFLLGRVIADEAELLTLAVDPACRNQGIGGRLVGEFLAASKQRGASAAFLEVAEDNAAARRLYLGAGFAESGRRKGYYGSAKGDQQDAIVMIAGLAVR